MREFFEELREHWDDAYWWADRQLLLAIALGLVAGVLDLFFVWLKIKIAAAAAGGGAA